MESCKHQYYESINSHTYKLFIVMNDKGSPEHVSMCPH